MLKNMVVSATAYVLLTATQSGYAIEKTNPGLKELTFGKITKFKSGDKLAGSSGIGWSFGTYIQSELPTGFVAEPLWFNEGQNTWYRGHVHVKLGAKGSFGLHHGNNCLPLYMFLDGSGNPTSIDVKYIEAKVLKKYVPNPAVLWVGIFKKAGKPKHIPIPPTPLPEITLWQKFELNTIGTPIRFEPDAASPWIVPVGGALVLFHRTDGEEEYENVNIEFSKLGYEEVTAGED